MIISQKKISVFVGGAQKSGTTSLCNFFRQHNQIAIHRTKEGHFFDRDQNFEDEFPKPDKLEEFYNKYEQVVDTKIMCDVTPDYIFRKNAIERIYNYNSDAIWIILLRNPIDRAFSSWNMEVNRKTETLPFEDALESELNYEPPIRDDDRFQYLGRSLYLNQILKLWNYFPKSQCQIYPAELVWQHPKKYLNIILSLLNLSTIGGSDYMHSHKGAYQSQMTEESRKLLEKKLALELNELPKILGWKSNPWIQ